MPGVSFARSVKVWVPGKFPFGSDGFAVVDAPDPTKGPKAHADPPSGVWPHDSRQRSETLIPLTSEANRRLGESMPRPALARLRGPDAILAQDAHSLGYARIKAKHLGERIDPWEGPPRAHSAVLRRTPRAQTDALPVAVSLSLPTSVTSCHFIASRRLARRLDPHSNVERCATRGTCDFICWSLGHTVLLGLW